MPNLPVNIDGTYPDDPARPGIKAHQQAHDVLHGLNNDIGDPATIVRTADLTAHVAAGDPHTGYVLESTTIQFPSGLVSGGVTDNRATLEPVVAAGGVIELPAGTFALTRKNSGSAFCLDMVSNTVLRGQGKDITTLRLADDQLNFTVLLRINVGVTNVTVMDMTLDGNQTAQLAGTDQMHCVNVNDGVNVTFVRCRFTNSEGDGVRAGASTGGTFARKLKFVDCEFDNNGRNGITLGGVDDCLIQGCRFEANIVASAIDSEPTRSPNYNVRIIGNHITDDGSYAITTKGKSNAEPSHHWTIANNVIVGGSIYVIQSRKMRIAGNVIIGSNTAVGAIQMSGFIEDVSLVNNYIESPAYRGINVFPTDSTFFPSRIGIVGNTVYAPAGEAVRLASCKDIRIQDNMLRGAGAISAHIIYIGATIFDIERVSIKGNTILNGNSNGVIITRSSTWTNRRVSIIGNTFDDTQGTATMSVGVGTANAASIDSTTFVIADNVFGPPVTSPISTQTGVYFSVGGNIGVGAGAASVMVRPMLSGTGTPEAVVAASVGSMFLRRDGGASTTLYIKETGTTATGWRAV